MGHYIKLPFLVCRDLLPGGEGYVEDTNDQNEESGLPDISLVTGRVRTSGKGKNQGCQIFL